MGRLRYLATGHQWEKIPNDVRIVMLEEDARIEDLEARIAELEAVLQGMIGGKVYVAGHGFVESNESRAARTALKGNDDG